MLEKTTTLFNGGKLANYVWFFGYMAFGIAAIIGMAWAYCGAKPGKQRCRASGGAADICAAKKGADQ